MDKKKFQMLDKPLRTGILLRKRKTFRNKRILKKQQLSLIFEKGRETERRLKKKKNIN